MCSVIVETERLPSSQYHGASESTVKRAASGRYLVTWVVAALLTSVVAVLAGIGADARWLAALGAEIVRRGHIPSGVPYAVAPSSGWENVPVLGELVFHGLEALLGDRGLVLAQVLAVGICLVCVSIDMRRARAADTPAALVLVLVAFGAAPALVIARSQLFSLVLFPLSLLLLRSEARSPSSRIWLLAPLFVLWSNLHGAVLLGLVVAASYLLLDRLRRTPGTALGVLALSTLAILATPASSGTVSYYWGVLHNEAAVRGEGLWAPLSLRAPLDLIFVVVAVALVFAALRSRPPLWELVVLALLAASSVHTSRTGVWLLLFAAAPAACGLTNAAARPRSLSRPVAAAAFAVLAVLLVVSVSRPRAWSGAGAPLLDQAARAAGSSPILADGINAEKLALAGHLVWISNPIDAFPRSEQRLYLDWLEGKAAGDAELARARVVLVGRGGAPQRRLARDPAFREVGHDRQAVLYVRT